MRETPNTLRIALSAKFSRREEMRAVASWLRSLGYVITSRWLESQADDSNLSDSEASAAAVMDVKDVLDADVLVAFAERPLSRDDVRGGRHVELGVALASGKPVVLIGRHEHVFHRHPRVTVVACKTDMARALRAFAESQKSAQVAI